LPFIGVKECRFLLVEPARGLTHNTNKGEKGEKAKAPPFAIIAIV
jgi:hypothetical protein